MDEGAMSPVVGVALLVAITALVSAGIAAVMEKEADEQLNDVPAIGWQVDEAKDAIEVVQAPSELVWSQLAIRADQEVRFAVGQPGMSSQTAMDEATQVDSDAFVQGSDSIAFCGADGDDPLTRHDVKVRIVHLDSGRLVHVAVFQVLAAC